MSAFNFKLKISLKLLIKHLFRFIKNTNKAIVGGGEEKRNDFLNNLILCFKLFNYVLNR